MIPYISIAFLRNVSHAACALFSELLDELRQFIAAPRKQQGFRQKVKFIALHLGMLHSTIKGNSNSKEPHTEREVSIGLEKLPTNVYTLECQKSISKRLFPQKKTALEQLRHVGRGFDLQSFDFGSEIISRALPQISLQVSRLTTLPPVDTRLTCDSEDAEISASPMILTSLSKTNQEEMAERPDHDEQHNVIWKAEKAPSYSHHISLLTEGKDTPEVPAVSTFAETSELDLNHDPNFNMTSLSPTANASEANETSQIPIIRSFEEVGDIDIQSNEAKPPSETLSKRVRWSPSTSSKPDHSLNSTQPKFLLDSEAAFTQAWHSPSTFKDRKRLSRVLRQLSALQVTGERIHNRGRNEVPEDPDRPASYPRTERLRKSVGVSVKVLGEGFDRLNLSRRV